MSDRKSGVSVMPARVFIVETETYVKVSVEVCVAGNLWLPVTAKSYQIDGKSVLGLQCAGQSLKETVRSASGFQMHDVTVEVSKMPPASRVDSAVEAVSEIAEDSSVV